jgi:nuclear pore complex protein Nup133
LYPRVKPSQILSSSSDKQLRGRFRPEQWPHIQRDLELENDVLRQYMENGKLELWFKDLLELAASDSKECHFGGYSGTIP